MKIVRKPLLDINGVDLATGLINIQAVEENDNMFQEMLTRQREKAQKRIEKTSQNGKIFVEGFGRCTL